MADTLSWSTGSLKDFVDADAGIKPGPFGSSLTKAMYKEAGYRVYGQEQVIGGSLRIGDYYISAAKYREMNAFAVEAGDLLLSLVGTIGRSLVVEGDFEQGIINPRVLRLRPNRARCHVPFLRQLLASTTVQAQLEATATGGTMPVLNGRILKALRLPVVPLPEQRQIAEILDTLDDAIRKTEEIIAKLKRVKHALLHDLLSRGIDDNGELRDPLRHPEQFKDSPLGRIPKGWDTTSLEQVSESVTSGSRGWAAYYADSGALFIRIGNLTRQHINLRYDSVQYVQPPRTGEGTRTSLLPGDLLISITADLGIIGVVPLRLGEAYVNQHIALVRIRPDAANSRWLAHYLASPIGHEQIRRLDDSGAKAGLNLPTVRRLRAAKPPRMEQDELTTRLDSIDAQVEAEGAVYGKLRLLKQGLMEDLLTGRVRVTKLLEDAAE